jgi:hypothetical protein
MRTTSYKKVGKMLALSTKNDALIYEHATRISAVMIKYKSFMHDANSYNYTETDGVYGACWQYVQYFNLIEKYIDRGKRRIKTIGDIGCGIGLGYLTFQEFFSHLDVEFINLKRSTLYYNKYDHCLNALNVPYVEYSGNFELDAEPPVFPDVKLDVGIANRVVLENPAYNWDIMRPLFAPGGLLLTTEDYSNVFKFDIKHQTFK